MGKKKDKEKDKSKKQVEQSSEKAAEQSFEQLADAEDSEQSLIDAMEAARKSAMALQEAASAFSRQMSAANELLADRSPHQGFNADADAGANAEPGTSASGSMNAFSMANMAPGGFAGGMNAAVDSAAYGASQYSGDAYGHSMAPYPANQSFGRSTNYRSLSASRRANKAQAGFMPAMSGSAYPIASHDYGYAPNMQSQGYAPSYYQPMFAQRDTAYQPNLQPQISPYGSSSYQDRHSPYGYNGGADASTVQAQAQSRAAAKQVAAAQSAAFTAASKTNAASSGAASSFSSPSPSSPTASSYGMQGSSMQSASSSASAYGDYSQNPAYVVNEDLLTNLPKFGEAPYPLPEPHEILESVPSLASLAYGTTAAQAHTDLYSSQPSSADAYSASDASDYSSSQIVESSDDGVIFAYVEEAEPIDLLAASESKKGKKKKKKNSGEEYGNDQEQHSGASARGSQDVEEISIPAVYGSEEGFSVELPAETGGAYAKSASEEVSAVYYEVDDGSESAGNSAYYAQAQPAAGYGGQSAQAEQMHEGYTHESGVYESNDGYYYDDAGNVFYYDENGYPYYYGEDGNAYYYDDYAGYGGQLAQVGKAPGGTGLVLGIFSILLAFIPIVGLILGIIAMKKAKKHINMGGTSSSAYTAKLLGKLGVILSIILLIAYIGLVVAFFLSLYPPAIMTAIRTFLATTPLSFVL